MEHSQHPYPHKTKPEASKTNKRQKNIKKNTASLAIGVRVAVQDEGHAKLLAQFMVLNLFAQAIVPHWFGVWQLQDCGGHVSHHLHVN